MACQRNKTMAKNKTAINIGIGATVNDSLGKSFDQAKTESRALGREYTKINKQLSKVQEVNKYRRQLDTLNKRMKSGRGDTLAMQKVHARLTKELNKSRNAARRAGANMSNLVLEERRLKEQSDRTRRAQAALNTQIKKTASTKLAAEAASPSLARRGVGVAAAGLGKAAAPIAAAAAAAVTTGAMINTTLGVLEKLDESVKRARRMNMDFMAVQELEYAANRSGIDPGKMETALQRQVRRVQNAAQGTGTALDALEALRLDAVELTKLAPEKQLELIADAMAKVAEQSDKIALAQKLWDSGGVVMLNMMEGGGDEIRQLRKDRRKLGGMFSEEQANAAEDFNDQLLNLQVRMGSVRDSIAFSTMPAVLDSMEGFNNWLQKNSDTIQDVVGGLMTLVNWLGQALGVILQIVAIPMKAVSYVAEMPERTRMMNQQLTDMQKDFVIGRTPTANPGTPTYDLHGMHGLTYSDNKNVNITVMEAGNARETANTVSEVLKGSVPNISDYMIADH